MSQQSHIRLLPEHYDRAVDAIASVAARRAGILPVHGQSGRTPT
jgi:hypothetical protein